LPDDYLPPNVPDTVAQFLQHVQAQTDVLTELSAAGFAFTIALWAAAHGILHNFTLPMSRWSILLPVTAVFLATSTICGFLIRADLTGYLAEIASGWNFTKECYILDARQHLFSEYYDPVAERGKWQIRLNVWAAATLVIWVWETLFGSQRVEEGSEK